MDIELFVMLLAGHYLADFALQPDFMADKKRLVFIEAVGFHALTAHAFIHGLLAGLLSQNFVVGLVVGSSHWLIDFGKSSQLLDDKFPHTKGSRNAYQKSGLYGINIDQLLHVSVIFFVILFVLQ